MNRQRVWPREGLLIRDPFTMLRIDPVEGAIVDIDDGAIRRQLIDKDLFLEKPAPATEAKNALREVAVDNRKATGLTKEV